jgi:hypothetical protein
MDHDEFEIAIEQRLRGALDADHIVALDRHLVDCEACRSYEARARAERAALADLFASRASATNWTRFEARAKREIRRQQYIWPAFMAAIAAQSLVVGIWGDHRHIAYHLLFFAILAPLYALAGSSLGRYFARKAEATVARELARVGALALYKKGLDSKISLTRRLPWISWVVLVCWVALLFLLGVWSFHGGPLQGHFEYYSDRSLVVDTMILALITFASTIWSIVQLPRLLRARGEME